MPPLAEVRKLAREFERTYTPKGLPERLGMFSAKLGIDRVRFLRMLGLSPEKAKEYKNNHNWNEIVGLVGEQQARWLESLLVHLLSMYSYNWRSLSEDLHNYTPQPLRNIGGLEDGPNTAHRDDILLSWIANGGPDAVLVLRDYLAAKMREPADR